MKLRYTRPALAELDEILSHIAVEAPESARRVRARLRSVIDLLVHHPHIGVRTDDPTIRRLTTLPYP